MLSKLLRNTADHTFFSKKIINYSYHLNVWTLLHNSCNFTIVSNNLNFNSVFWFLMPGLMIQRDWNFEQKSDSKNRMWFTVHYSPWRCNSTRPQHTVFADHCGPRQTIPRETLIRDYCNHKGSCTLLQRYWTHGHRSGLNECVMLRNTNRYTNRLQLKTTIHWSASCTPTKLPVYWLRQHFRPENNI